MSVSDLSTLKGDDELPAYNSPRTLKLLSLDGGGVRGLSSLYILQELMQQVADDPRHPPKPCYWFDMIGGTSTGGLIAIMLGRLQMSVKDCIDAYTRMMGGVFTKSRPILNLPFTSSGKIRPRFNTRELESAIKAIVEQTGHGGETLRDPNCKCKVFVCATENETTNIHLFSTYQRRGSGFDDVYEEALIWEACRATSAASSFFEVAEVGRSRMIFLDGATGANNPIFYLWEEARSVFGDDFEKRLQLAVSIGTGRPDIKAFGKDLKDVARTMIKVSTNTEMVNQTFEKGHMELFRDDRFFRFNVQVGLGSVGLEEVGRQPLIRAATHDYLELNEVRRRVDVFKYRANSAPLEPKIPPPSLTCPSTQSFNPSVTTHTAFLLLDASSTCVNRNPRLKTSYWARITRESHALYERCFKDMTGNTDTSSIITFSQFHGYLSHSLPSLPHLTAGLISTIWSRLRVPGNPHIPSTLPKPLALAALCMAHMEGIVNPGLRPTLEDVRAATMSSPYYHHHHHHHHQQQQSQGQERDNRVVEDEKRLSDSRLKYLRLFDTWVDCRCGCGRQWNFVSDPPDALWLRRSGGEEGRVCLADGSGGGEGERGEGRSTSSESGAGVGKRIWSSLTGGSGSEKGGGRNDNNNKKLVLSSYQQQNLRTWFELDPVERMREEYG